MNIVSNDIVDNLGALNDVWFIDFCIRKKQILRIFSNGRIANRTQKEFQIKFKIIAKILFLKFVDKKIDQFKRFEHHLVLLYLDGFQNERVNDF